MVGIGSPAFYRNGVPEAGAVGGEDCWRKSIFLEAMVHRGGSVSCSCPVPSNH